jgi:hypothetical protein
MLKTQYDALKVQLKKEHLGTCETHKLYTYGEHLLIDISPADELQFFGKKNLESRVNHMWQLFKPHFDTINRYTSKFNISMEISKTGRIHFHTNLRVLVGKYIAHEIGYMLNRYQVRIDVDTIKDISYRDAYIRKDTGENLRFLSYDQAGDRYAKEKHLIYTDDSESETDSSSSTDEAITQSIP